MNIRRFILVFILYSFSVAVFIPLQAQDYTRLSERTIMGSARYVGMAGAMTAIGGDPSAVRDNPAGLGLYRRMEVMFSMEYANQFTVPQASWVISVPTFNESERGAQFHNFMISYHRTHSYWREWYTSSPTSQPSLGAQLGRLTIQDFIPYCTDLYNTSSAMTLREYGSVDEFDFSWGSNFSNQWYVGAALHVHLYGFSSYGDYSETFDHYSEGRAQYYNRNTTVLSMRGASCNASLGLIYRPTVWLRLGLGIETPSFGHINSYTEGTFRSQTDSLRITGLCVTSGKDRSYHQPFRTSASVAFQAGAYGLFALQYDYAHAPFMKDLHTIKIGVEAIPILGMYLNLGYAYESTFKPYQALPFDQTFARQDTYTLALRASQYASAGIGYRGTHMMAQLAYQFHWQQNAFIPHPEATALDVYQITHRIVLTLGWHHN